MGAAITSGNLHVHSSEGLLSLVSDNGDGKLLEYVRKHPGCSGIEAIRSVGMETQHGYRAIDRILASGLVYETGRQKGRKLFPATEEDLVLHYFSQHEGAHLRDVAHDLGMPKDAVTGIAEAFLEDGMLVSEGKTKGRRMYTQEGYEEKVAAEKIAEKGLMTPDELARALGTNRMKASEILEALYGDEIVSFTRIDGKEVYFVGDMSDPVVLTDPDIMRIKEFLTVNEGSLAPAIYEALGVSSHGGRKKMDAAITEGEIVTRGFGGNRKFFTMEGAEKYDAEVDRLAEEQLAAVAARQTERTFSTRPASKIVVPKNKEKLTEEDRLDYFTQPKKPELTKEDVRKKVDAALNTKSLGYYTLLAMTHAPARMLDEILSEGEKARMYRVEHTRRERRIHKIATSSASATHVEEPIWSEPTKIVPRASLAVQKTAETEENEEDYDTVERFLKETETSFWHIAKHFPRREETAAKENAKPLPVPGDHTKDSEERVYTYIRLNPGRRRKDVVAGTGFKAITVQKAIDSLSSEGYVVTVKQGRELLAFTSEDYEAYEKFNEEHPQSDSIQKPTPRSGAKKLKVEVGEKSLIQELFAREHAQVDPSAVKGALGEYLAAHNRPLLSSAVSAVASKLHASEGRVEEQVRKLIGEKYVLSTTTSHGRRVWLNGLPTAATEAETDPEPTEGPIQKIADPPAKVQVADRMIARVPESYVPALRRVKETYGLDESQMVLDGQFVYRQAVEDNTRPVTLAQGMLKVDAVLRSSHGRQRQLAGMEGVEHLKMLRALYLDVQKDVPEISGPAIDLPISVDGKRKKFGRRLELTTPEEYGKGLVAYLAWIDALEKKQNIPETTSDENTAADVSV